MYQLSIIVGTEGFNDKEIFSRIYWSAVENIKDKMYILKMHFTMLNSQELHR